MSSKTGKPVIAWERLVSELTDDIFNQRYPADSPLPGEYPLCRRFECSRTTVRRAMEELEKQGLIYRRQGKGTFAHPIKKLAMPPAALVIVQPEKLGGDYFVELIRGCNSYLNTIGSTVTIMSTLPAMWPAKQREGLAGVILIPAGLRAGDLKVLREQGLGYITIMESDLPGPMIAMNPKGCAYKLTQLLCSHGHRHFGLVSGHYEHADQLKRQGIQLALAEAGLNLDAMPDVPTDYTVEKAEAAARTILTEHPETTAMIAFDDALAMQIMAVASQMGIRVPGQLSVVGFNNTVFSSLSVPALTTVHFPAYEAGRTAARLLARHYFKKEKLHTVTLNSELVIRDSVAKVSSRR